MRTCANAEVNLSELHRCHLNRNDIVYLLTLVVQKRHKICDCRPTPPTEPVKESEWSEMENDVVHLTDATFDDHINGATSVLVMFYAPCKCGMKIVT
jgi:hypothetical protein